MANRLGRWLGSFFTPGSVDQPAATADKSAATALQPLAEPKVKPKQQTQSSFSKRTATSTGDQRLAATDRRTANLDLLTLRNGTSTKSTIRDLSPVSPDLSAAIWAYQRMVVTRGWRAVARTQEGQIDVAATGALQQLLARMNFLTDYAEGFNNITGLHAVAESLTKELVLTGSCSQELVLDKSRLPSRLQPISTTQIEFYEDTKGLVYPVQRANGEEINLDIPTFFYESLDQDLLTAYSDSPLEAAITASLADAEFIQDVRRVIKRALHPRLTATIDGEKFRAAMPASLNGDAEATEQYQDQYMSDVEATVNGLQPDDALVNFDTVKFDYLNNGNVTLSNEYATLSEINGAKMATGAKAPPAVLGHGSGSQNVASSESMLFVKYCEGIQNKLNSIFSRALTLATRLLGHDVYVVFEFDRIDLRPEAELEAFRAQRQSRILLLLSIGLYTDEEAALLLTGQLPPAGHKPLRGTFFMAGATDPNAVEDASTAASNTSALNKAQTPDTPSKTRGPAKKVPA